MTHFDAEESPLFPALRLLLFDLAMFCNNLAIWKSKQASFAIN